VSDAGLKRRAYSLDAGGFIARRAPYEECVLFPRETDKRRL